MPKDAGGGGSVGMLGYAGKLWSGAKQVASGAGINTYSPGLHQTESTVRETYGIVTSQMKSSQEARKALATALKLEADYTREVTKAIGEYNEAKARGDKDLGQYQARINKFNDSLDTQRNAIRQNTEALSKMQKGMSGSVLGAAAAGAAISIASLAVKTFGERSAVTAGALRNYSDQMGAIKDSGAAVRLTMDRLTDNFGAFQAAMQRLGVSSDESAALFLKMHKSVSMTQTPMLKSGDVAQKLTKDLSTVARVLDLDLNTAFEESSKYYARFGSDLGTAERGLFRLYKGVLAYNAATKAGKLDSREMARGVLELAGQTHGYTLNVKRLTDYYTALQGQARAAGMTQQASGDLAKHVGGYLAGTTEANDLVKYKVGGELQADLEKKITGKDGKRLQGKELKAALTKYAMEATGGKEGGDDVKNVVQDLEGYLALAGKEEDFLHKERLYESVGQNKAGTKARARLLMRFLNTRGSHATGHAALGVDRKQLMRLRGLTATGKVAMTEEGITGFLEQQQKGAEAAGVKLPTKVSDLQESANLANIAGNASGLTGARIGEAKADILGWLKDTFGLTGEAASAILSGAVTAAGVGGTVLGGTGLYKGAKWGLGKLLGGGARAAGSAAGAAGGTAPWVGNFADAVAGASPEIGVASRGAGMLSKLGGVMKGAGQLLSVPAMVLSVADAASDLSERIFGVTRDDAMTDVVAKERGFGAISRAANPFMGDLAARTVGSDKTKQAAWLGQMGMDPAAVQKKVDAAAMAQRAVDYNLLESATEKMDAAKGMFSDSDKYTAPELLTALKASGKAKDMFKPGEVEALEAEYAMQRYTAGATSLLPGMQESAKQGIKDKLAMVAPGERLKYLDNMANNLGQIEEGPIKDVYSAAIKEAYRDTIQAQEDKDKAALEATKAFWKNDMPGLVRESLLEPLARAGFGNADLRGAVLPGGRIPPGPAGAGVVPVSGTDANGTTMININAGDARNPIYLQVSLGTNPVSGAQQLMSIP